VASGKPDESFTMYKLDGNFDCAKLSCVDNNCGSTMPQTSTLLDQDRRDIIRRWIAQGALDN
jgi:hypothetical protein